MTGDSTASRSSLIGWGVNNVITSCRIAILLTLLLCLAGCAVTPTARWAQARDALTTGQNVTLQLHDAGVVSDEELVAADQGVQAARRALSIAESQLPDGGQTFEQWMHLVDGVLETLQQYQLQEAE